MSTVRMPNPAVLVPGATAALTALTEAIGDAALDGKLLALSRLRASQINGCASGVADAAHQARQHGATADQLLLNIAITNANNRLDAPTRQEAGTRQPVTTERN